MPALTNTQLGLIDAISKNDMPQARKLARICVADDTSKKNALDCKRLARALDPSLNPQLYDVPIDVKGFIEAELPAESFQVDRYYLSDRELEVFTYIDQMRSVCEELAGMGIKHPNTTLLFGASGTGKTTFSRYVAAKFDLPFYLVNFSRLIDSLMGKTSQNLVKVFDYIKTVPCVFMLDEIDTIAMVRKGGGDGPKGELNRVVVALMQEFDKLDNSHIIIGATNRLDILDPALVRRFSRVHEIVVPKSAKEATGIVKPLLKAADLSCDEGELVAFCNGNLGKSQAWFVNAAIDAIIAAISCRKQLADLSGGSAAASMGVRV